MGNAYYILCRTCRQFYWLGKENEWIHDPQMVYLLRNFLMQHQSHSIGMSGDSWNFDYGSDFYTTVIDAEEPAKWGWTEWDDTYSKQDYENEQKEEKRCQQKPRTKKPTKKNG